MSARIALLALALALALTGCPPGTSNSPEPDYGSPEPPVAPVNVAWEPLRARDDWNGHPRGYRCKTPGGWLIRPTETRGGWCYVPDPKHEWGAK